MMVSAAGVETTAASWSWPLGKLPERWNCCRQSGVPVAVPVLRLSRQSKVWCEISWEAPVGYGANCTAAVSTVDAVRPGAF